MWMPGRHLTKHGSHPWRTQTVDSCLTWRACNQELAFRVPLKVSGVGLRSEYCEKFGAVSEEELLSDLTSQIHRNAEIACDKYGHLGKAMRLALCFSVVWAVALALLVKV